MPCTGPGTKWALRKYLLSKGREGWRAGEQRARPYAQLSVQLPCSPAPSLAEVSAPHVSKDSYEPPRGMRFPPHRCEVTITPVAQGRNQGVVGHLLPSPWELEDGCEWPDVLLFPELSLPCGHPGLPMEPALCLQVRQGWGVPAVFHLEGPQGLGVLAYSFTRAETKAQRGAAQSHPAS